MARVRSGGVDIDLPRGWEGQIRPIAEDPLIAAERAASAVSDTGAPGAAPNRAGHPGAPRVVLHASNFPLPAERGDFGGGAVEQMGPRHVFVSLVEYDRADAGSALFTRQGVPRRVRAGEFHPQALQRALPGQAGLQHFFTAAGRAFCLYVVIGSHRLARVTVAAVNEILSTIEITDEP
jgi:hypothetical protein